MGTHTKVIDNPPKFVTVVSVNLREWKAVKLVLQTNKSMPVT